MADKPQVILIRESLTTSVLRDAITFCMTLGLIGIGIWADSSAMQWVGALMTFMAFYARVSGLRAASTYSIPEARTRLDELEAGR